MRHKIFYFIMLCIPVMVLEGFFRFLPVSYPPHLLEVNDQNPVARFKENVDYLWSRDWNFSIVTRKRTNNQGFASDYDYVQGNSDPLMVVIGDSFVEAQQVANAASMAGILAKQTEQTGRVYSLGLSGAALSQYLVYAEYAKQKFSANAMVFIIVGNDFDESLLKYKSAPSLHYFKETDGGYELTRVDYKIGGLKKLLRKSAFSRYVFLNLQMKRLQNPFNNKKRKSPSEFVGNVPRNVSDQRLEDSKTAVDEFFRQLPSRSDLSADKILFVVDGMRPNLYSEVGLVNAENSYFGRMRSYFIAAAIGLGYEVRDMQPVFIKRNRHDGSTFEFKMDGHWNSLGHSLVASEIAKSQLYNGTFTVN